MSLNIDTPHVETEQFFADLESVHGDAVAYSKQISLTTDMTTAFRNQEVAERIGIDRTSPFGEVSDRVVAADIRLAELERIYKERQRVIEGRYIGKLLNVKAILYEDPDYGSIHVNFGGFERGAVGKLASMQLSNASHLGDISFVLLWKRRILSQLEYIVHPYDYRTEGLRGVDITFPRV